MVTEFPPLYKKTNSGKVSQWVIGVEPSPHFPHYDIVVHSGFQGGAIQEFRTTIKEGKNQGRSNATTPMTQAIREAQAGWEKAKKKGYVENLDTFRPMGIPMGAHKFSEHRLKATWPAIVQPKLEGIHCKILKEGPRQVKYYSSKGNLYYNFEYMTPYFSEILANGEEIGAELYAHDTRDLIPPELGVGQANRLLERIHFEDITSLVKNPRLKEDREKLIKAHCFDLPRKDMVVQDRLEELANRILLLPSESPIQIIPHYYIDSEEEFYEKHQEFTKEGFEGTMYRRLDSLYQWDYRSYDLLKHKDFVDFEFPIVSIQEGVGKFAGKAVFTCRADNGNTFEVITRGSAEKKEYYLQNAFFYISKPMTVRYQRLTKRGVPYLPVGYLRDYE